MLKRDACSKDPESVFHCLNKGYSDFQISNYLSAIAAINRTYFLKPFPRRCSFKKMSVYNCHNETCDKLGSLNK